MMNESEKTSNLFSDNQISEGYVETSPTIVAPSPTETRSAGRAQQISVLIDVNSPKKEIQIFFFNSLFGFNFFYSVT